MDIHGKTVTEIALERRISELEVEVAQLRHKLSATDRFIWKPQEFVEIKLPSLQPMLTLAVRADAELVEYDKWSIRAQAGSMSKGILSIGYYFQQERYRAMNDYGKADYLNAIFQNMVHTIADGLDK